MKVSLNLEANAWNEFKSKSDDIVIKLVEDFDHSVDYLYIAS